MYRWIVDIFGDVIQQPAFVAVLTDKKPPIFIIMIIPSSIRIPPLKLVMKPPPLYTPPNIHYTIIHVKHSSPFFKQGRKPLLLIIPHSNLQL